MRALASSLHDVVELRDGWRLAHTPPDAVAGPDQLEDLDWLPAEVPGSVAGALQRAGRWNWGEPLDIDGSDWWLRTRFETDRPAAAERIVLVFEGLATIAEVWLNGTRILSSDSMFRRHELDVSDRLLDTNELAIAIRALRPRLAGRRRPRARWRTSLVPEPNLRFVRTMLLGRAPGFAPGPAVAGAWRPVRLERRRGLHAELRELRTRLEAQTGVLHVSVALHRLDPPEQSDDAAIDRVTVELYDEGDGAAPTNQAELGLARAEAGVVVAKGTLAAPGVQPWWPHTHGHPALHRVRLLVERGGEQSEFDLGQVGFRTLSTPDPAGPDGLQLELNGARVFVRGAVWTPDLLTPSPSADALRETLELVVSAGINMLRIPGTGAYESEQFHALCDELGILVWQDLPFANFDYPEADEEFMATVADEVAAALASAQPHPSLAVVCGGSEVDQQVAMLGLDPQMAAGPLFGELLPRLFCEAGLDVPYLPSSPWGDGLPFRNDTGVAHYFGVGGYRRGLEDARRAEVKFAAECLALANVPDERVLEALTPNGRPPLGAPAWKASVPRDATTSWDFEDVRDHYLQLLYGVEPGELRASDPERYLELSRATSGELMAEVFGEWRRGGSPCGGGLVLWLADLAPGSGWGILDHQRTPKAVYHHLRRALAPAAVWSTDEGLNGIAVHVANDGPDILSTVLRISLYRGLEVCVATTETEMRLAPHSGRSENLEDLLGRFVDVGWAYRFGPPAQDLVVLALERAGEPGEPREVISQSVRLPLGRPVQRESARALGLTARVETAAEGGTVTLRAERYVHGVRIDLAGMVAEDQWFSLEPGRARTVAVAPTEPGAKSIGEGRVGTVHAVNLSGPLSIERTG